MSLIFFTLALLISFYLLARVTDEYFVSSLEAISEKLGLSSDAAGATLMAMGSSAPELFVAIIALVKPGGHEAVGMGTIVGSALFNVLVIVGVSSVIKKSVLSWQPVVRDTLFYSLSIALILIFFWDGKVTWLESAILVAIYALYVFAVVNWKKWLKYQDDEPFDQTDLEEENGPKSTDSKTGWKKVLKFFDYLVDAIFPSREKYWRVFLTSILAIGALSWVLVESAVHASDILNIPSAIVALTVLAAGTSIPDLLSSMAVARKGKGGMAISNALGSNVFDILIGLGLPWVVMLGFSGGHVPVESANLTSSVILLFATVIVIFFLLLMRRWRIGPKSGYFLIGLYVLYLIWAIAKALS